MGTLLGAEGSGVFIDVEEPEFSRRRLEAFEQKYGMASSVFYALYQRGVAAVDEETAEQWAFEYEVNTRANELAKLLELTRAAGGGQPLPLCNSSL